MNELPLIATKLNETVTHAGQSLIPSTGDLGIEPSLDLYERCNPIRAFAKSHRSELHGLLPPFRAVAILFPSSDGIGYDKNARVRVRGGIWNDPKVSRPAADAPAAIKGKSLDETVL
jgi:hypothetical protein